MEEKEVQGAPVHKRRVRYSGTHPKRFEEKYKEQNPEKYADTVEKVIKKGSTPAGMHISICVNEILDFLDIRPGMQGLDATLGYGGHTTEMLKKLEGQGHMYGLDVDPIEIVKTKARLKERGFDEDILTVKQMNFADIDKLVPETGLFDFVLADLGVSSMQIDNPERGFTYKADGPLDLRLNPEKGISAAERLKQMDMEEIAGMFVENSDEPYAEEIAEKIHVHIKSHGSQLAPMDCWLLLRGIKTLPVRMDRHNENAKKVAEWLRTQPKVKKVYYVGFEDHKDYATTIKQTRGFGGMISFTVDSFETVQKILRNVDMIMFAESLGGTETLITYPTTQTHEDTPKDVKEKLGITDRFLRMSVGIENVEDIIADLDRAMNS